MAESEPDNAKRGPALIPTKIGPYEVQRVLGAVAVGQPQEGAPHVRGRRFERLLLQSVRHHTGVK